MTGFELRTSGIESDCSTNWATTNSLEEYFTLLHINVTNNNHSLNMDENMQQFFLLSLNILVFFQFRTR